MPPADVFTGSSSEIHCEQIVDSTISSEELIQTLRCMGNPHEITISDDDFVYLKNCISLKNCLGLTVLAKQFNHTELGKFCNEYIEKNFDVVVAEESLKLLSVETFDLYLKSSGLLPQENVQMIAVYWASLWKDPLRGLSGQGEDEFYPIQIRLQSLYDNTWDLPSASVLMSPRNCIVTAVLVKRLGDEVLTRRMEEYINANVDTVVKDESFVSLSKPVLVLSLKCCHISKELQTKLIIGWVDGSPDDRMKDVTDVFTEVVHTDEANTSIQNAIKSLPLTLKYPELQHLSVIFSKVLKDELSPTNCFRIADVACKYGLEDLKFAIDCYIVRNFYAIGQQVNVGLFQENRFLVFLRYLEVAHIPKLLCDVLLLKFYATLPKGAIFTIPITSFRSFLIADRNVTETCGKKNVIKQVKYHLSGAGIQEWEFSLLRMRKSRKSRTIGPEGGVIELHGCCLQFPEGALEKETEISIEVDNNPDNFPKEGCVIAPILSIEPSMDFVIPIIVKMHTWFRAADRESKMATLFSRKTGSSWKEVDKVPLGTTNEVEFPVWHFSGKTLTITESDSLSGTHTLKNSVYIQCNTGMVQSNFYCSVKDEHDVHNLMRGMNCSRLTTHFISVEGNLDDIITVEASLTKPRKEAICWSPDNNISIKEVLRKGITSLQAMPELPLKDEYLVQGFYEVYIREVRQDRAILCREWPVTLDPEVRQPPVKNVYNTAAMNVSHGNGPINNRSQGDDLNLEANA